MTSATGRVQLGWAAASPVPNAPQTVIVCNTGSNDAYVALGNSSVTATTSGFDVRPGACPSLALNANPYLAGITASSTTTLVISTGNGTASNGATPGSGVAGGMAIDASNASLPAAPNNLFKSLLIGTCANGVGLNGSGNVITTVCPSSAGGGLTNVPLGFTLTPGTENTGSQTVGPSTSIYGQEYAVAISSTCTWNSNCNGSVSNQSAEYAIATGNATITLPNPSTNGNPIGTFCSDGTHVFTLTTAGGAANFFGSASTGTGVTSVTMKAGSCMSLLDTNTTIIGVGGYAAVETMGSGVLAVGFLGASPASHAVPVDVAGTSTYKVIPNCIDTGGNHLNYTQSADAFSCGTSSSGGGGTFVKSVSTAELDCDNSGTHCGAGGTTLTNITGLSVVLSSSTTYACEIYIPASAAASGGVKIALAATDTLTVASSGISYSGVISTGASLNTATTIGNGIGNSNAVTAGGFITGFATINVNVGGTLQVQGAQNLGNATQSKFLVNSYMQCQ